MAIDRYRKTFGSTYLPNSCVKFSRITFPGMPHASPFEKDTSIPETVGNASKAAVTSETEAVAGMGAVVCCR